MSLWHLDRIPEPEEMDAADEVAGYATAAAARHLAAIDDTFVDHLLRLLPSRNREALDGAWALDIGTGPAQIPIRALTRLPALRVVGLDRFPNMLRKARQNAELAGVGERLVLLRGDGQSLPFADHTFAMVMCNSVLHHMRQPLGLLREIFRVVRPEGSVLVRDLRRPPKPFLRWHLWKHGRHYTGAMRRLFAASVRAAYTAAELQQMIAAVQARDAAVFRYRDAHIGIEKRAAPRR